MIETAIEDLEIRLFLQAVREAHGYDFGDYAQASLKRRLLQWLASCGYESLSQAQGRLLREPALLDSLVQGITVNVTEMFRDPPFFAALRDEVLPYLKTFPTAKIWHAGCSSGEEAYSLAILLREAGMAGRYRLYASDINSAVLETAKAGIYSLASLRKFTQNYQRAGGVRPFSDYYTAAYGNAIMAPELREDLVFVTHNLAIDADIGEMHMVLCRNVMIYFKGGLKERCLRLFDHCLVGGGFLCLGSGESLSGSSVAAGYAALAPRLKIYQKHGIRSA